MPHRSNASSWTTPADVRSQVQKLWDRGELLTYFIVGQKLFPKRLVLRAPSSTEMAERFDEVRAWIEALRGIPHCRIEMRRFKHRLLGENAVPHELWVDSIEDALALISKRQDAARFTELAKMTRSCHPELLSWLARRPLCALELLHDWPRLLAVVSWVRQHPRPGIYLRQVDIPGVHSKFIEGYRALLSELLDSVLPPAAVDRAASGVGQFAKRYGFLDKPTRVRFRIFDQSRVMLPERFAQDLAIDTESFARLDPDVSQVFITENEINFLAFPNIEDALLIFGAGYGFEMLSNVHWLARCRINYWGDIDTHGFAILDQLRAHFGDVQSFLMDRATLMAFESLWGEEKEQTTRDLPRLNANERSLYDDLRDNRIRSNLRLEQEKIGFAWVEAHLPDRSRALPK